MKTPAMLLLAGMFAFASFAASASEPVVPSHEARGLQCTNCHVQPNKPDFNKCIECHGGLETLMRDKPQHAMLKNGQVPCTTCHQGHPKK